MPPRGHPRTSGGPQPPGGCASTPEGQHLLVLARDPDGLPAAVPGDQRGAACREAKRAAPSTTWSPRAGARRALGDPPPVAARAPFPRALASAAQTPRPGGTRGARRHVRPPERRGRADQPRPAGRTTSATTPCTELALSHRHGGDRHRQRALRAPRVMPGWPRRWPRSGPAAAWTRWTAGWPLPAARTSGPARRWPTGSRRYPGVAERAPSQLARDCAFGLPRDRAQAARLPRPGQAHRGDLAARAGRREAPAALRPAGRRTRSRAPTPRSPASSRSSRHLGFPGYFLIVHDIVRVLRTRPNILCQGRGSAANSAVCYALGITSVDPVSARPAVRAVPVGRPGRAARHRPGHRAPPPRGGDPVRLPHATAGTRPPRWPT